jgi:tetratricopeptide (TPR) repeat protein
MFGFGFNKEKSRASAEKYLQQNKLQNAISEYEKILQVEPHDLAILNTVGDVYARLGQNDKAIERFRVIGESYANDGSTLKAIAMYKKITKLDPNGLAAMEKLAELYRKQGLVSDARSMLLLAAEAYTRKGQSKETLRLLKQLVLFDPENVQVITRTADLMTQGGQKNEAKQMLSQTASTLIDRHALDPALKILERLIALDRGNLRAQELRAQVTFELGDAEKAAELFELIPDLDSRIDGLRNLLSAYLKLGNLENALVVARKLVSVHQDAEGVMKVASRLYKENDTLGALAIYNDF